MSDTAEHSETQVRNTTRGRTWVFTWNNYTENDVKYLLRELSREKYIFGEEVGTENTPHLQGAVRFRNARTFEQVRKIFKNNHIERCQRWNASKNYCKKDGLFYTNIPGMGNRYHRLLALYNHVTWRDWQAQLLRALGQKPDDRKVIWVVDQAGNSGKSFLCKYLFLKYGAIIADGKKDNVFNQVKAWIDTHKDHEDPTMILLDVPRHNAEYINYGMIEQLKNGLIYSGKYEGGVCVFESPHVVIFSNDEPDYSKFTTDRWVIITIE